MVLAAVYPLGQFKIDWLIDWLIDLSSSLRITNRSFRYASPCICMESTSYFCLSTSSQSLCLVGSLGFIGAFNTNWVISRSSLSVTDLTIPAPTTSSRYVNSPLSPSITLFFTLGSKPTSFTNLSHHRLSSGLRTDSTDFMTGPFLLSISIFYGRPM